MTDIATNDLSNFGYRELDMAGDLLKACADNGKPDFLGDGLTLNLNNMSGYVFLSDENYNVGIMQDGRLVQFFNCPECGYEGTQADAKEDGRDFEIHNGYCSKECEDKNN